MNYIKIDTEDVCNGDGLRVVLWLSGCSHHCKGCQNPQTWNANSGIQFDESAKEELFRELDRDYISGITLSGGDPLNEANLGDVLDLVSEINKRYNETQDIVCCNNKNHNILNVNTNEIRLLFPNKSIWLYTGYEVIGIEDGLFVLSPNVITDKVLEPKEMANRITEDIKRSDIIKNCDVLIDGRYVEEKRDITLKWRGSSNQRVIDVQKSLQQNEIVLHCD